MVSNLSHNHCINGTGYNPTLIFSPEIWLSYIIPVLESSVSGRFHSPNHRIGFKHESILHVVCEWGTQEASVPAKYFNLALPRT